MDNEVKGTGNQQDYGMRIYDPRAARFLSVDPLQKEYPELTPYQFANNNPIIGIDRDGLELKITNCYYRFEASSGQPKLTFLRSETHTVDEGGWFGIKNLIYGQGHTYQYWAVDVSGKPLGFRSGSYEQLQKSANHGAKLLNGDKEALKEEIATQTGYAVAEAVLAKGLSDFGGMFKTSTNSATTSSATNKQAISVNGGIDEAAQNNTTNKPQSKFLGGAKGKLYSKQNILEGNHAPTMQSFEIAEFKVSYNKGSAFQMLAGRTPKVYFFW